MARLIDADVMLNDMQKELEKAVSDETMTEFDCKVLMTSALALKDFVNRQPTAYDVEKVVEELDEAETYNISISGVVTKVLEKYGIPSESIVADEIWYELEELLTAKYEKAIEIVRKGGVVR